MTGRTKDGQLGSAVGELIRSVSPQRPADVIGEYPARTPEQVQAAAGQARDSQRDWWRAAAAARSAALSAAAAQLRARRDEAAALITREVGKPAGEAAGEVARSVSILEYYAQACFAELGAHYPPSAVDRGGQAGSSAQGNTGLLYTERRPHGVAGLITPWNFPLAIPLWKAAPALAAGNAVLLKPSPEAAGCAELIGDILGGCLPAGLLTVLPGGAATGAAVVAAADVVSFTGSVQVGRQVAITATGRGVPVQCEMGGQNAAIILPDADPAAAAAMVAGAAMGYAGQKCTATRRIIVVGQQHAFVAALTAAVAALAPADPAEPGTVVGPLITDSARAKVLAAVALAAADGARVLTGGSGPAGDGWFAEPALVDGLPPGHPLCQQETFGPFAVLQHADDVDSAVALANGVEFGLVSSVHGGSLGPLLGAVAGLDTGLIRVNAPTTGVDFYAPFGGEKASGLGHREQGMAALAFYASTRTITIAAGPG